jgi:hypothetical protein
MEYLTNDLIASNIQPFLHVSHEKRAREGNVRAHRLPPAAATSASGRCATSARPRFD